MRASLAARREPAGDQNQLAKVLCIFDYNMTVWVLTRASFFFS